MIVESQEKTTEKITPFYSNFYWTESNEAKWILKKRECLPIEIVDDPSNEYIEFDHGEFDRSKITDHSVKSHDEVFINGEKYKVTSVEEGKVFAKKIQPEKTQVEGNPENKEEEDEVFELSQVKFIMKLNFLILGYTKTHLIENVEINYNSQISTLKDIISEILIIPFQYIKIFHNETVLDPSNSISSTEIKDRDTLLVSFENSEILKMVRSSSRDYSMSDKKHLIVFTVDKPIMVYGFGFWKNYYSATARYDFKLYEINEDGSRMLVCKLDNVVIDGELDSNGVMRSDIKKPVLLKANTKYHAYVYYLLDLNTYYSYSCSSEVFAEGVLFRFFKVNEPEHRCEISSGHLPHIYFKIYNPYQD